VANLESYRISYASVHPPLRIGYKSDEHPIEMFDFYISGLKNKKACKGHPTSFIDIFSQSSSMLFLPTGTLN